MRSSLHEFWAVLIIVASVAAYGASEGKTDPVARALRHADGNQDGQVTFDELRAVRPNVTAEQFQKLDQNDDKVLTSADEDGDAARLAASDFDGDGKVSLDEANKALPGMTEQTFERMDRNQDGVLSAADRPGEGQKARMRDRLHKADLNRDGKVTFDEARQAFPEMTQERFTRLDRSGDGYLTQEDAPKEGERAPIATRLRQADKNGDGKVTYAEAQGEFPNMTQERFDAFDKNGDGALTARDLIGAAGAREADAKSARPNAGAKLFSADKDGDGRVTFEEVTAAKPGYPRESFDRIDSNNDGAITSEDLE